MCWAAKLPGAGMLLEGKAVGLGMAGDLAANECSTSMIDVVKCSFLKRTVWPNASHALLSATPTNMIRCDDWRTRFSGAAGGVPPA